MFSLLWQKPCKYHSFRASQPYFIKIFSITYICITVVIVQIHFNIKLATAMNKTS